MTASAPQPIVSGTGGGMGARVAALATVVALAVVVWLGVSGRAAAPTPAPSRPAALAPTQTPAVSPEPITTGDPAATPRALPTPLAQAAEIYVINGVIGASGFRTELVEYAPDSGRFRAQYWVPSTHLRNGPLAFEITPSSTALRSRGDTLGSWLLNLESLAANRRAGIEGHTAVVAGRPTLLHAPSPVRQGFALHVSVALALDYVAMVDFQLHVVQHHAAIQGSDGIIGCLPFSTCEAQDRQRRLPTR